MNVEGARAVREKVDAPVEPDRVEVVRALFGLRDLDDVERLEIHDPDASVGAASVVAPLL